MSRWVFRVARSKKRGKMRIGLFGRSISPGKDPVPGEPMVNRDDEFRRKAAKAQRSARRATTDDERANWTQLAEGWRGLIRKHPQTSRKRSTSRSPPKKTAGQLVHSRP